MTFSNQWQRVEVGPSNETKPLWVMILLGRYYSTYSECEI